MGSTDHPVELCNVCAAIDFERLVYPVEAQPADRDTPLGNLKELAERTDKCQLCSLIVDGLRERYKRTPREHIERERMSDVYDSDTDISKGSQEEPHQEVETYGMRVTWNGLPIECCIKRTFFCAVGDVAFSDFLSDSSSGSSVDSSSNSSGGSPSDSSSEAGSKGGALYVHRLMVKLEPCPWSTFGFADYVQLHATWPTDASTTSEGNEPRLRGRTITLTGSSRRVTPLVDISRVTGWLQKCEKDHGEECGHPKWLGGDDEPWLDSCRVIDVNERRVVDLSTDDRYVALSYVWGSSPGAVNMRWKRCLTADNLSQLQEAGGIDAISLPQTVNDAVDLVLQMGERYLWVDALCIIQDDLVDVSHQTSRMDLVYSRAVFTIIAACGDNSDSGLIGVPGRPRDILHRQVKVSSSGLHLAPIAALSMNESLQLSVWNARGWTFQERLLSRRALVFTSSQLYWLCGTAMWDEEVILERPEAYLQVLPQALGCNDEWDDGWPKFSKDALSQYITQFSERQFTFPADALPAFMGIVRRYEHLNKEKVHWGLPEQRFDQALMWRHGNQRREALYQVMSGESKLQSVPYPSWSWLGWTGFIGASLHNNGIKPSPELTFYSLMSDGHVRMITSAIKPSARDPDQRDVMQWKGDTEVKGPMMASNDWLSSKLDDLQVSNGGDMSQGADEIPYDTGRLVFWTSQVEVTAWLENYNLHIEMHKGSLKLDSSVNESVFFPSRRGLGVIVDDDGSSSVQSMSDDDSSSKQNIDDDNSTSHHAKRKVNLVIISRFYEIASGKESGKLNIMIVEEKMAGAGIWSRLGVAVIAEQDWVRLERQWRMIILE
ncbi:hypothetical protein FDECE_10246 [Fusarium decemcellulare]|nr:hypothetical protein FDECE_10246 [Fusarium decemcellulare]